MGSLKRQYLTAEEKNFYMIAKAFIEMMNGKRNLQEIVKDEVWTDWENR